MIHRILKRNVISAQAQIPMSDSSKPAFYTSPEQQAIRDKCFHPSGKFIEFPKEDVETSIPERFEKIVGRFPDRLAVKMRNRTLTYQELNHAANRVAHAILAQRGETQEPIALLMEHDVSINRRDCRRLQSRQNLCGSGPVVSQSQRRFPDRGLASGPPHHRQQESFLSHRICSRQVSNCKY